MHLLLIEDDEILGEGLHDYLATLGHQVQWCRTLGAARVLREEPFDAWLVDWQLPDGSGLDWLRAARSRGQRTPALMITARDLLADRIQGLDSGADDYLVKPFAPEELAARVRALTRRSGGSANTRLQLGVAEVEVDLTARTAWRGGERAALTAREWSVLEALVLRAGRVVAKADLETVVLGTHSDVQSNALEVHVSGLRRKLGAGVIETVRGLGYRVDCT
jgi:two-component system OmpR family response regulator